MPLEDIERVNKLGEADKQPSLLTFYDRHGNPVGDSENTSKDLIEAPEEKNEEEKNEEEKNEENDPVPEITGVDQELPDDKQQYLKIPDNNKNDNDMNYGTKEIGDPTEGTSQINDDIQTQEKEPAHPQDTPIPVNRRSTRLKKPVNRIIPSFEGKKYDTAAVLTCWEHTFATLYPDTHMCLSQGIDYDHFVFYAMTQISMKAGMRR